MSLGNKISQLLNVKTAEKKSVQLLLLYSLFMGIAYAFLYSASTSLFLADFKVNYLPYAYMGGGAISYILWLVYSRLEKRVVFSKMFLWGAIFLLVTTAYLTLSYDTTGNKWYSFLLFTWVNIFVFINGVGFWGIAGKVFNLQQGKRLFGLISSGEVLSKVISFFSVPLLVKVLDVKIKHLLYLTVGGLVLCLVMAFILIKFFGSSLSVKAKEKVDPSIPKTSFLDTVKIKYYGYFLLLAIFPLFAAYFVDFIFLDQTKVEFGDPQTVSSFLGIFFGFMSVAEFLIKTFMSGYFINRYGILFTLLILPVMLFFTTFSTSVYGSFLGVTTMLFSFIALSKLFVRVLRTSFLDPAFQVMYQPIATNERQLLQSKVEGISKSFGNFLAGGVLIVLSNMPYLNVVHYNYFFLVVVCLWIWLSVNIYHEYRNTLRSILSKSNDLLESSTLNNAQYYSLFDTGNTERFKAAFNLVENLEPYLADFIALRSLSRSATDVQVFLLEKVKHNGILPALKILDYCKPENDFAIKRFESTKRYLQQTRSFKVEDLINMSRSTDPGVRLQVAKLIAHYDNYYNYKILINLLQDEDKYVRNAALITSGKRKRRELWPLIIKNLYHPDSCYAATIAIKVIKEPILVSLLEYNDKNKTDKYTHLRILKLCSEIGGKKAVRYLRDSAKLASDEVKNHVFGGLMSHHYKASSLGMPIIKQMTENDIGTIAWIIACLIDIAGHDTQGSLTNALKLELRQKQENVFLQLSTIYDSKTISFFVNRFTTSSEETKAYALEILDLTLSTDFKSLVAPILSDQEPEEMLEAYQSRFPQHKLSVHDRLEDIINKDYRQLNNWTKCCAIELLDQLEGVNSNAVVANLLNPDAMISETSLYYMHKDEPDLLQHKLANFTHEERKKLRLKITSFTNIGDTGLLLIDIVNQLKQTEVFSMLSEFDIVNIMHGSEQIYLPASITYDMNHDQKHDLFVVLKGEVELKTNTAEQLLIPGTAWWNMDETQNSSVKMTPKLNTIILRINFNQVYELLAEKKHLIKKMIDILSKEKEVTLL